MTELGSPARFVYTRLRRPAYCVPPQLPFCSLINLRGRSFVETWVTVLVVSGLFGSRLPPFDFLVIRDHAPASGKLLDLHGDPA